MKEILKIEEKERNCSCKKEFSFENLLQIQGNNNNINSEFTEKEKFLLEENFSKINFDSSLFDIKKILQEIISIIPTGENFREKAFYSEENFPFNKNASFQDKLFVSSQKLFEKMDLISIKKVMKNGIISKEYNKNLYFEGNFVNQPIFTPKKLKISTPLLNPFDKNFLKFSRKFGLFPRKEKIPFFETPNKKNSKEEVYEILVKQNQTFKQNMRKK